ncbi:MAG: serine/threonine-protein kinase [Gemmatimonadota bacterium]|nr:serine/threonine-protein kinase [Gemmatimonadota bacterium]
MTDVATRLAAALSDRYVIERELGQGGMATVYLAEDVRHRRKVAVKVVHPELAAVLGAERFLSEIHVTAALQHPHILPLFDSGQADGQLFYVMPFVEGESLRGRLHRERQLPIDEAVKLTREVASALDYAHRHGVIHRDIKPENILLHDGQAVVADFGIALAVTNAGGGRLTQTGLSLGTPQYMSPEQATGERDIDARSDVYSLGAVAYEMLSGEPPFTGPTAQAIVAKVITTEPQKLSSLRKSIPAHIEDAVQKALEKMPADRFSSAADFSKALGDSGFETTRVSRKSAAVVATADKRWKLAAISLGIAVVALSAFAGWQMSRPVPTVPVSRFAVSLDQNYISLGTDAPNISPDGSKFVYASEEGGLLMRDRNELTANKVAGAENGWSPFFSPGGETIGFVTGFPGSLNTVPTIRGPVKTVYPDSAYGQGGSWSDDGWIYFLGTSGGVQSLMRVRPSGESLELIAKPDTARNELFFYWPEALPGGRAVLATLWRRRGTSDVVAIDVRTRKVHTLGSGVRAMYAGHETLVVVQPDGSVNAVRFRPGKLTTNGQPVRVLSGVRTGGQGRIMIALSRSGSLLYEAYTPNNRVVRVTRDGSAQAVDPGWTGAFSYLSVSRDGTRIAVAAETNARTDIWSKNLQSGTFTRLASEGTYSYRPFWTPDGARVFFVSDRSGKTALYSVAADGGSPPRLERQNPRGVDEGDLSSDGKLLVHRVGSGGGRDIYVAETNPDAPARALVNAEAEEFAPTLSPDGRWLAYSMYEAGRSEIYVRPFPDVGRTRWQVSRTGGTEPVWSHNGRELFFRDSRGYLIAAQVSATDDFRVTGERQLFRTRDYVADTRHRAYSVSPDGQSFYFIDVVPGHESQLILISNWVAELREKLKAVP